MEKSKRIDPKQCVQILALYRLPKINQARETLQKPSPNFCHYQLPVTLLLLVFRVNSVLVLKIFHWSSYHWARDNCRKILVSSMNWSTHLLFIFMEMWLPIEIWYIKGPLHLPPQTDVWLQNIPQFTVPREQFLAWGRAVLCGAKPVISHPEVPPGPKASQGFHFVLRLRVASGFWNKPIQQFNLSTKSGVKDLTRRFSPYKV